jgi:hypothetical protein
MLNKKILATKGVDGGLEGVIAGALTVLAVGFVKQHMNMDSSSEAQISIAVGSVVTGAVIALSRLIKNYLKHRK